MNPNLFKTTIAALALIVTFNSCKKDDEPFLFPADEVELLLPDGAVVDTIVDRDVFVNASETNYTVTILIGTEPDNFTRFISKEKNIFKPGKYYWHAKVTDNLKKTDSEFSETRTFYVPGTIKGIAIETDNGENENAIVLRWKNLDRSKYSNINVQMTPTKECSFAGKTFDVPDGQDSLYIKLNDNTEIPYMFNDFDDKHGINYEPIVYNFTLTADVVIADKTCKTHSKNIKEIFLNKKKHIRDHEFNVYRVAEVGDQIWMADDLRCTSYIDDNGDTIQMKLNKDYVISELPSGAKGILYNHDFLFKTDDKSNGHLNDITPTKYHYAADEDWNKLENVFGINAKNPKLIPPTQGDIFGETAAFPSDETLDYIKSMADSLYVVESPYYINLWAEFASESDWVDREGNAAYPDNSVFNIKPFGLGYTNPTTLYCQGYGAMYYSRPYRTRTFYSLKKGIGHYLFTPDVVKRDDNYICYAVRFVRDITK